MTIDDVRSALGAAMMRDYYDAVQRLEALGNGDLCVSVAYGYSRSVGRRSVFGSRSL